jgi:hypothetical protein
MIDWPIHSHISGLAAGAGPLCPAPTFGPGVPLGHRDPIRFFTSPALDSALQPKDDPFGRGGVRPWMSGGG